VGVPRLRRGEYSCILTHRETCSLPKVSRHMICDSAPCETSFVPFSAVRVANSRRFMALVRVRTPLCLGRAGDAARELLPWAAGPNTQKNFDPEHLSTPGRTPRVNNIFYPNSPPRGRSHLGMGASDLIPVVPGRLCIGSGSRTLERAGR
jgi:hypothetical protein